MSEESQTPRLDRVEREVGQVSTDVANLKTDMVGLRSDMRGFGGILDRIERGVTDAQTQWHNEKQAARIPPITLVSVLVSVISILVGGAWLISGELARHDERSVLQQQMLERVEARVWQGRGRDGKAAE